MVRSADEMPSRTITDCHGGSGDLECRTVLEAADMDGCLRFMHDDMLEPGAEIGEHLHNGDEEVYFVVEGHGTMIVDGEEHPIGPGDVSVCRSGHSHGIRNSEDGTMRLIVVGMGL
ncbi:MAG: cupin domain-containing protein [Armatimonadota bacterium]